MYWFEFGKNWFWVADTLCIKYKSMPLCFVRMLGPLCLFCEFVTANITQKVVKVYVVLKIQRDCLVFALRGYLYTSAEVSLHSAFKLDCVVYYLTLALLLVATLCFCSFLA